MIHAESFLGGKSLNNVYSLDYQIDSDVVILFLTDDPSSGKFLRWAGQAATSETAEKKLNGLPYDGGRVLVIDDSYYGEIVAGVKGDLLLGMVNYSDKHREFLIAWVDSLP